MSVIVNDIHSKLNEAEVEEVLEADSLAGIQAAVARARERGLPLAVCGGKHAMGGQQFCAGGLLLDARGASRVLGLDAERGTIEVEAGIQWPELYAYLQAPENGGGAWAFAQKQTGADRLTLGGAISANVHGRGAHPRADRRRRRVASCSSTPRASSGRAAVPRTPELFSLVVGGYGLFGVVYAVTLRLVPRRKLERVVEVRSIEGLIAAFDERVRSRVPLRRLPVRDRPAARTSSCGRACSRATARSPPTRPMPPGQRALSLERLEGAPLPRAHEQVRGLRALRRSLPRDVRADLLVRRAPAGRVHRRLPRRARPRARRRSIRATEMISELYVPRDRLGDFVDVVAGDFRTRRRRRHLRDDPADRARRRDLPPVGARAASPASSSTSTPTTRPRPWSARPARSAA